MLIDSKDTATPVKVRHLRVLLSRIMTHMH